MVARLLLALFLGALCSAPAFAKEPIWPQFRGPTGLGYATAKKLPTVWGGAEQKNVAWSVAVKGEGHASPVVVGSQVIVCNVAWPVKAEVMPTHYVTAYDLADGHELWSTEVPPGKWLRNDFRSGPGGGYAAPTPCIARDHIHCVFGSSVMAVLDLDGKLVTRLELEPHTFDVTIGSSPIVAGDGVVMLCAMAKKEDSRLISFEPVSLEVKWEQKLPTVGFAHSTPIVIPGDKPQVVIVASGGGDTADAVQSFDVATGERLWWARGAGEASSPAYADGRLYFDSGRGSKGTVVATDGAGDVTATHIAWTVGAVPEAIGSPIIANGCVYRLHSPNILKCWRLDTGKQVFAERLPEITSTWASPIVDGHGRLYFATAGKSYVLDPGEKLSVVAVNDLGDANHASPAVAGERLLLLGQKKLWCIGE